MRYLISLMFDKKGEPKRRMQETVSQIIIQKLHSNVDTLRSQYPERFASLILVLAHAAMSNLEVALQCQQLLSVRTTLNMLSKCDRYDIAFSLIHFVTYVYIFEAAIYLKTFEIAEFINYLRLYLDEAKNKTEELKDIAR